MPPAASGALPTGLMMPPGMQNASPGTMQSIQAMQQALPPGMLDRFLAGPMPRLSPSVLAYGVTTANRTMALPRLKPNKCRRPDQKQEAIAAPVERRRDAQGRPYIGAYSPDARKKRIEKFHAKRLKRIWARSVKYDVRKNFADSRMRVKGRFVKKEDEQLLRELMSIT